MRVPQVVEGVTHLGFPLHFVTLLGVWKVLGGIAVLVPGFALVKEWAYAGMFFDLTERRSRPPLRGMSGGTLSRRWRWPWFSPHRGRFARRAVPLESPFPPGRVSQPRISRDLNRHMQHAWRRANIQPRKKEVMQTRMKNPAMILPDTMQAIQALQAATQKGGVPSTTLGLVHLRASQINSCSACVDSGTRYAKKAGESDERLFAVAAWRGAPYFTNAERPALALTEAVTRLSDRADPAQDDVWDEAARHYEEPAAKLATKVSPIRAQ
jgi:AhpD family alkylhydroperoxidase